MLTRSSVAFLAWCMIVLCATPPAAAEQTGFDLPEVSGKVSVSGSHILASDLDEGGNVAVTTAQVELQLFDLLTLGYERRHFAWQDVGDLEFGNGDDDPWTDLHTLSAGIDGHYELTEELTAFGALGVSSSFEEEMDDSFTYSAQAGLSYSLSSAFTLRGGAVLTVGKSTSVLPFGGLDWTQQPGHEREYPYLSATLGVPRTVLRLHAQPGLTFAAYGAMDHGSWRLADDSAVEPAGYVSFTSYVAGLSTEYSPLEGLSLSMQAEYHMGREITVSDEDDDNDDTWDVDPGLGLGLGASYRF